MTHRHDCRSKEGRGANLPPCDCGIPDASQATHRHPESDPTEFVRNALIQCQYCWKSKASGVALKRCAGCQIAWYCDAECQTNAWPSHKSQCRINRNRRQNSKTAISLDNLRAFTSKHRPSLAHYGIFALDLVVDYTRCLRDILHLIFAHRPEAVRSELSFFLISADAVPLETLGAEGEEMREQLVQANEAQRRIGGLGCFFVVLKCTTPSNLAGNVAPVSFTKEELVGLRPGTPWRDELTRRLNEGIIV